MTRYTDDQKLDIFRAFERNNKSVKQTQDYLLNEHSISPDAKTIKRIHKNISEHHEFRRKPPGRPRSVRTSENIEFIRNTGQQRTDDGRPTSTRRLALEMQNQGRDISHMSIQRALRSDLKMKPYHERPVHELKTIDKPRRVQMARMLLSMIDDDPIILEKIIWTDEAEFKLDGTINSHNNSYWSARNPNITRTKNRINKKGIHVWAGIWAGGRIGPIEYDGRLTSQKYQDLLREQIIPQLGDTSQFWFMQDGAPAHKAMGTRNFLRTIFENRVIALGWSPEWAPRSPDLTPCDFFLWGHMKPMVYREELKNHEQLRASIVNEFREIDQDHIRNACLSVRKRLQDCILLGGDTVQHAGGR